MAVKDGGELPDGADPAQVGGELVDRDEHGGDEERQLNAPGFFHQPGSGLVIHPRRGRSGCP